MGKRGFTLIELMIVVVIIGIIAAIALPNLLSARLSSNETAAIATLRAIVSAQSQFQKRGLADDDNDGLGEYGTIAEMSGSVGVRGGQVLVPAVLSATFRSVNAQGEVARNGYIFRSYLPGAGGAGLQEVAGGGAPPGVDADLGETVWAVYAWPTDYELSGVRTFFVNHQAELIQTSDSRYTGPAAPIVPGAAMAAGGVATSITGGLATGVTGRDGNLWRSVGN